MRPYGPLRGREYELATALAVIRRTRTHGASGVVLVSGNAGLAVATVLVGLTVMMTRRLALGMLVGFLVLDNGIFTYAVTQTRGMPMSIELGVLFDVFVAVVLAGVVISRVSKTFEHIDVSEMRELRE